MSIVNEVLTEIGDEPQVAPPVVESINEEERRGNKAQLIREALDVLGETKPADIVDWLKKERNIDVTPTYVSLVKSQYRGKARQFSANAYIAAKSLVRVAGSIQLAKAVLESLEAEQENVMEMQDRYQTLLAETEELLQGTTLQKAERRELITEARRIRKLLGSINVVGTLAAV